MRIAFVADSLECPGGDPSSGKRFVKRLREDHDVVVISADDETENDVRLPRLFASIRRTREMGFGLARPQRERIAKALERADVVHLQDPFWLSLVAMEEAKRKHLPVVTAFHLQPESFLRNLSIRSRYATDWLYKYWIEHLYNRSDVVICPTEFAERKLRQHGLTAPAVVISNGTHSKASTQRREPRDPGDQGFFLILMVGRLAKRKQQEVLLRALRHCTHRHQVRVVLAGSGPDENELRELAASLPNKIEIGPVEQDRLDQLMARCDLFVHCADIGLESMAVLDAMNAGCPVVVAQSDESAASELALDERFTFPAGDERALAKRIDALIEQPEVRRAAGDVYQRLARRFPFEESAQKLITTYRTVIAINRANAQPRRRDPLLTAHPVRSER